MKQYLKKPAIHLKTESYLTLIVILAPLLNFLAGINVDIYSPSMPSIAGFFHASITLVKDTITASLLGWTIGALIFGILIDSLGRKKTLVYGLSLYVLASLFAPFCHSIQQLIVIRFLQGFFVASITIGCRAIIVDKITGPRYAIAILYTSIGYGVGPVIGPFIGGMLQHYIGWQANFIALTVVGFSLLAFLFVFIEESMSKHQPLHIKDVSARFVRVLKHKQFIIGIVIAGVIQIQIMLYATLGPFIVEGMLHKSVLVYGNTTLLIGAGYLIGTLTGRFLLIRMLPRQVCIIGFFVLLFAVILAYVFAAFSTLSLVTLAIPIMLICISSGLIFANIMGANLKEFPQNVGAATAMQSTAILFIGAIGIFIASHLHIANLLQFATLFLALALIQASLFFFGYQRIFDRR